jgi:hypothetical protein
MLSILCEVDFKEEINYKSYLKLKNNDHIENLNENDFYQLFIEHLKSTSLDSIDSIKKFVSDYILANKNQNDEAVFNLVSLAISCIQLFVQANWLGPLPLQINPNLPKAVLESQLANENKLNRKIFYLSDFFNPEVILFLIF